MLSRAISWTPERRSSSRDVGARREGRRYRRRFGLQGRRRQRRAGTVRPEAAPGRVGPSQARAGRAGAQDRAGGVHHVAVDGILHGEGAGRADRPRGLQWPRVIIKELVDNAIDACEEAEVAPVIKVTITTGKRGKPTRIVVEDNGPGIPTRHHHRHHRLQRPGLFARGYISPTRGRQGNALKTILPMAYVLGGKIKGETWIEARGRKHRILFSVNQIKQEPIVKNIRSRSQVRTGTRVTMFWPDTDKAEIDPNEITELLTQFIWVNPHLTLRFVVDGKTLFDVHASNPDWTKYRACDATSAHWYSLEQFERYAGALIARDQEQQRRQPEENHGPGVRRPVPRHERDREAESRFCANSARRTCRCSGSSVRRPRSSIERMEKLLRLLQQHTRPVRPELLGVIGEEHLAADDLRRWRRAAKLQIFRQPRP